MQQDIWVVVSKYEVKHRVTTPYHLQANRLVKVSNRQIKMILLKTINGNQSDWAVKLDDALWAYQTVYKAPIAMSLYQLVFRKVCHLPMKLEHRGLWALGSKNAQLHT